MPLFIFSSSLLLNLDSMATRIPDDQRASETKLFVLIRNQAGRNRIDLGGRQIVCCQVGVTRQQHGLTVDTVIFTASTAETNAGREFWLHDSPVAARQSSRTIGAVMVSAGFNCPSHGERNRRAQESVCACRKGPVCRLVFRRRRRPDDDHVELSLTVHDRWLTFVLLCDALVPFW
jgi:hypothetical protein